MIKLIQLKNYRVLFLVVTLMSISCKKQEKDKSPNIIIILADDLGSIFALINQMFSIFAPSIVTVFLWGILTKKGTANAAFWTLLAGSLFAGTIFLIEKYATIHGIENYISNADGLGIN